MSDLHVDLSILWPALIAGLLVVLSHVPLGQQVLARGIVFIDLAIAQVAGLGVIAAHSVGLRARRLDDADSPRWPRRCSARCCSPGPSASGPRCRKRSSACCSCSPRPRRSCCSPTIRTAARISRTCSPGRSCGSSNEQLIRAAVLTAIFLVVWFRWRERIGRIGFYVLFAVMVTVSVQLVGVYLVFTRLIVPALATYRHRRRRQLRSATRSAFASYVARAAVLGRDRSAVERGHRLHAWLSWDSSCTCARTGGSPPSDRG